MTDKKYKESIERLEKIVEDRVLSGEWKKNKYTHGLTNGIILAISILKNEEADYLTLSSSYEDDIHF